MASTDQQELCREEFDFVLVKKSRSRNNDNNKIKDIVLTNRFERLVDEPVHLSNLRVHVDVVRKDKSKKVYKKEEDLMAKHKKDIQKIKHCHLSHLETDKFHILEDVDDEGIEEVIKKVEIQETHKKRLKKCRLCNFKKRSCLLNPATCQAKKKACWSCKKQGHFTQSLICKKQRGTKKSPILKTYPPKSKQPVKDHLDLIFQTITKLENLKTESEGPKETQFKNRTKLTVSEHCEMRGDGIEEEIKKQILKSADYCARKFKSLRIGENKQAFSNYCSRKIKKVFKSKCGPLPNTEEIESIQRKLDVFETVYDKTNDNLARICEFWDEQDVSMDSINSIQFNCGPLHTIDEKVSLQSNLEASEKVYTSTNETIVQLDGSSDIMYEEVVPKCLSSVNCEQQVLITWLNFFRSLDVLWGTSDHCICTFNIPYSEESSCFYCLMRSSCNRLRNRGMRGPKNLKPYEALSQLEKFGRTLEINWLTVFENQELFVTETIRLLINSNINAKEVLKPIDLECSTCKISGKVNEEDFITIIDTAGIESIRPVTLDYVLKRCIQQKNLFQCNHELGIQSNSRTGRLMIISFSNPITLKIQESMFIWKTIFKYKAHIVMGDKENTSFFQYDKQMIFQDGNRNLKCSEFGPHSNIRMMAFHIVPYDYEHNTTDISQNIYNSKVLLHLHKQQLSILNPDAYEVKKNMEKVADKKRDLIRNQTPEKKDMKKAADKKRNLIRNQTPEMKDMKKASDKKRNLKRNRTPEMKDMKKVADKDRKNTPKRKISRKKAEEVPKRKIAKKTVRADSSTKDL